MAKSSLLPSLPFDLIQEILQRTPAKSLIRFKSTCKRWYALVSSDKKFMQKHLDNSPERFLKIDVDETVQIMDPATGVFSVTPIPHVFRNTYPIVSMVHCDGLMLCMCRGVRGDAGLAVWNPFPKNIKWIQPSVCYWGTDYFGFGYEKASRHNYKILRFSGDVSFSRVEESDPKCEIYDFNSVSWRSIDAEFGVDVDTDCVGVSVEGSMYWIALRKEAEFFILSFEFSLETFTEVCICSPFWETRRLGCFNGDRLSLLTQDEESMEIHVWVTNKLSDVVVSFSKYFSVTRSDLPALQFHGDMALPGYFISKKRSIMAWCEGDEEDDDKWYTCITFYEIDQGGVRKQIETGRHGLSEYNDPLICSYGYVPSLIPVPK
ncbi:PREDICTED: putative F-box only protein 15 [Camelina sativa]|uniref:F-box only protein 15 n=1 Tax=Camelina sativa TaxID=90675 RepID=A0ABM0XCZ9_CAMSA|nr:PREDICTED: putative F-box only protein 15 [Camelina sativa]